MNPDDGTAIHLQPQANIIIYSLHSAALPDNTHVLRFHTVCHTIRKSCRHEVLKIWMNIEMNIMFNEHLMLWILI